LLTLDTGVDGNYMSKPIAEFYLYFEIENKRTDCHVSIMAPEEDTDGSWKCTCHLPGLYSKPVTTKGENSMQALVLIMRLIGDVLNSAIVDGKHLMQQYSADDVGPFQIEMYFPARAKLN
jgi:hypothetical protein